MTVFSILGKKSPTIESKHHKLSSNHFFVYRELMQALFLLSDSLTEDEQAGTIYRYIENKKSKYMKNEKTNITIPDTPFKLPVKLAECLIGGIYRESWKILFNPPISERLPNIVEIKNILKQIPTRDWIEYKNIILALYDLIEDIRILSLGLQKYPNTEPKINSLWEAIAKKETIDLENPFPIKIILHMLRDLWLGNQNSDLYHDLMDTYREKFPHLLLIAESLSDLIDKAYQNEDNEISILTTFNVFYDIEMWFGNKPKKKEEELPPDTQLDTEPVKDPPQEISNIPKIEEKTKEQEDTNPTDGTTAQEEQEGSSEDKIELQDSNLEGNVSNKELTDTSVEVQETMLSQIQNIGEIFGVEELIEKEYGLLDVEDDKRPKDESEWKKTLPIQYFLVKESSENVSVNYIESCWIEIKDKCNFLINNLRRKILSSTFTGYIEGVPRGKILSDRYLTDTALDLRSDNYPLRAFKCKTENKEISTAGIILIDMSASMRENSEWLLQVTLLCAWFLDKIGGKSSVIGFRNGRSSTSLDFEPVVSFFQYKEFSNSFNSLKVNLCHLMSRLNGGTPTSDAVKLGLDNLEERLEKRKILFVITDGKPNTKEQLKQTKNLCYKSKKNNIITVGIGIGTESQSVTKLFENSAWSKDTKEINREIFKVLNKIL
jgi:hypothetical protein